MVTVMNKYFLNMLILLAFCVTIIGGCNLDNYTGYDYSAQDVSTHTKISGYVTNFFNGYKVENALIRFGDQETLSDHNGFYTINYVMSDDEARNKPTIIEVIKEDYYYYTKETQLLPDKNIYDFDLKYASPIIMDTRRRIVGEELICQAIVKDYQGIGTLERVEALYIMVNSEGTIIDSLRSRMRFVHLENASTAWFQLKTAIPDSNAVYYYLEAHDEEGYSHKVFHTTDPRYPDHLLFDPY